MHRSDSRRSLGRSAYRLGVVAITCGLIAITGSAQADSDLPVSGGEVTYSIEKPSYVFDAATQSFTSGTQAVSVTTPRVAGLQVCLEDETGAQDCKNTDPLEPGAHAARLSISGMRSSTPPELGVRGNDGTWSCPGTGKPVLRIAAFTGPSLSSISYSASVDDTELSDFVPFSGSRQGRALNLCSL